MSKKNRENKQKVFTQVDVCYAVYGQYNLFGMSLNSIPGALADLSYKIYVTDDASKDYETQGKAFYESLKQDPKLAYLNIHKKNEGFAKTLNDSAKIGTSKYILVMSTDVFLQQGSVKIMVEHIEANPDIAIISPKLLFPPNSKDPARPGGRVQHAGMCFDISGKPYHRYINWPPEAQLVNTVKDLNIVTGACFLIRRSVWNQLKGFDTDYGKGTYEDMDLCIRTRLAGYKIRYLPQVVGYHATNASVIGAGENFPLDRNYNIFRARYGEVIPYDDWFLNV